MIYVSKNVVTINGKTEEILLEMAALINTLNKDFAKRFGETIGKQLLDESIKYGYDR